MLVLILKCAAFRQANGHQLDMGDCFREEGPVKLYEGNVMIAFVQVFWVVSLVDNNLFSTPGTRTKNINICLYKQPGHGSFFTENLFSSANVVNEHYSMFIFNGLVVRTCHLM